VAILFFFENIQLLLSEVSVEHKTRTWRQRDIYV